MKYNILYVIDNMEFGGGERGFAQIIYGINRSQYKVHVACNPGGEFEARLRAMGIRLERMSMKSKFNLFTILKLIRILKEGRFHIVHTQGARADFFGRVAGRLVGVPHILCTMQMPVEGFDVGRLRKKIYRFIDSLTECYVETFIVVSDFLKKTLIERRGIPAQRVVKIYNGIELGQYHPDAERGKLRNEWGISQDIPFIGAIGRMVWQKGFKYMIQAIPDIVRDVPDAKFLFVGDGPLREGLEALSEELRVKDNVIFTGFRSDIREILSAVNLLVIPSLLEGFPMITLEAMAMAKPIIATNIDGITEQITDGVDGILVLPKDPEALAKAIIRILGDKGSAQKLGLAARKKVEQEFSVEKMISETEKVYLSLLKAG
jgi:glycosyltransferase involved in cell wall biosynthesis